jgi:hypothetical protein
MRRAEDPCTVGDCHLSLVSQTPLGNEGPNSCRSESPGNATAAFYGSGLCWQTAVTIESAEPLFHASALIQPVVPKGISISEPLATDNVLGPGVAPVCVGLIGVL